MNCIELGTKTFDLNEAQQIFINNLFTDDFEIQNNDIKEFAFFGGVRAGKSFIYQLAFLIMCSKWKINALYVRDTYDELKSSVIKQFCDDFEYTGLFTYLKAERKAYFKSGSTLEFRAYDTDGKSMLSTEYDVIGMCQAEEISEDLFLLSLSRLSGKGLTKQMIFVEGNPASSWPFRRYKEKRAEQLKEDKILFIDVDIEQNRKNLPLGYIEFLEKNYPKSYIERYLRGNWLSIDEAVFSEFREKDHEIMPVSNAGFKTYIGMDYGWVNPTALVWGFVDYDGVISIFDEWGGTQKISKEIKQASMKYGNLLVIADYSIKAPDRDGRSLWDDLTNSGMMLTESNKQELENITLVNMLLKTGRLRISKNCVELLREIKGYKWKRLKLGEQKNHSETPVQKDNHYIDAMLYLCSYIERLRTTSPDAIAFKNSLAYANQKTGKKYIKYG
jgi:PBSX family phage terminase large subunit